MVNNPNRRMTPTFFDAIPPNIAFSSPHGTGSAFNIGTADPVDVQAEARALITAASLMNGSNSAGGASLALAALHSNNPQHAFTFLAASSAQNSLENREAFKQGRIAQQQAAFRTQKVEQLVNDFDYSYNTRWSRQGSLNEKLFGENAELSKMVTNLAKENVQHVERTARLEAVTKQLVELFVQSRGGDASQLAGLMKDLGL